MTIRRITQSEMRTFRNCPRLWKYKYLDGIRPIGEGKALMIGTVIHESLEIFWKGGSLDDGLARIAKLTSEPKWKKDPMPMEAARCRAMIRGYWKRWEAERENWELFSVEETIMIPLWGKLYQAGKLDAIAKYKPEKSKPYMIEHKTSSDDIGNSGEDYWQRLTMDLQVTLYKELLEFKLERDFGTPVGILYDVLKKTQKEPILKKRIGKQKKKETDEEYKKRKETNETEQRETLQEYEDRLFGLMCEDLDEYFVRRTLARTIDEVHEYQDERDITVRQMEDLMTESDEQKFIRNDGACRAYFGTCAYLDVCTGCASLQSAKFEKVEKIHHELGPIPDDLPTHNNGDETDDGSDRSGSSEFSGPIPT